MDQDRKERWGVQADVEEGDIGEMMEAGNERRRRQGRPEASEEQLVEEVTGAELGRLQTDDARRER